MHMTSPSSKPLSKSGTPKRPRKGAQTKSSILQAALGLATQIGLDGLTIGALAEVTQMSKSGVFAHFGSREELQVEVVRQYHRMFEEEVFFPALKSPKGLPRLVALFDNWLQRSAIEVDSGCIYISGALEFEDNEGPVREELAYSVKTWHSAIVRAINQAVECGHLTKETEASQLLFQLHGLVLALHYEARFLKNPDCIDRAKQGFRQFITPLLKPDGMSLADYFSER